MHISKPTKTYHTRKNFYRYNPPIFPVDMKHRQFKLIKNNKAHIIKDTITTPKQLQHYISKYNPDHVYYSVSQFIDPQNIRNKSNIISKNTILTSLIAIDVDSDGTLKGIETARMNAAHIYQTIKNNLKYHFLLLQYIAFTGRGFHLVYKDKREITKRNPTQREEEYAQFKKTIVSLLISDHCTFDTAITLDTRRVIRVPNTINSKNNLKCTIITSKLLLNSSAKNIIEYACVLEDRAAIPVTLKTIPLKQNVLTQGNDVVLPQDALDRKHNIGDPRESALNESPPNPPTPPKLAYILFNYVQPLKDKYVLTLEFDNRKQADTCIRKLEPYHPGTLHMFERIDDRSIVVLGTKTFPHARMLKILKSINHPAYNSQKKYKSVYVRISSKNSHPRVKMHYLRTFYPKSYRHHNSSPHTEFLEQKLGIPKIRYDNKHGTTFNIAVARYDH